MTIETEQTTSTTETPSSETTTTETSSTGDPSSSATTEDGNDDDDVDLSTDGETTTTTGDDETELTDEQKAAEEARAELFGAPAEGENYVIEGLPDGMEIDTEALEAVTPTFRELGLSSKGASKVAAVYAEKVLPLVTKQATTQIEQEVIAQRSSWETETREAIKANGAELKNKAGETLDFGGNSLENVRKTAAKALDHLAPAGFREFLSETGLSVHPAMMAFAYRAGLLLAEDTELETAGDGNKPATRTQKYYGR